jgi:hypothetical protein
MYKHNNYRISLISQAGHSLVGSRRKQSLKSEMEIRFVLQEEAEIRFVRIRFVRMRFAT